MGPAQAGWRAHVALTTNAHGGIVAAPTNAYSTGMALILAACLVAYVIWCALTARPSRRWIKRMQRMEEGRARQEAEFVANNCFREWRK